jgi:mRNA interferase MazF
VTVHRGQIVRADVGLSEPKLFLVVSNNRRNRNLGSVLGVRLTTTDKPDIPSIVVIPPGEVVVGRVLCDDITLLYDEEIIQVRGALSPRLLKSVERGLASALGMGDSGEVLDP